MTTENKTLQAKLKRVVEFDIKALDERAELGVKVGLETGNIKSHDMALAYLAGAISLANWQHSRLKPLLNALIELVIKSEAVTKDNDLLFEDTSNSVGQLEEVLSNLERVVEELK